MFEIVDMKEPEHNGWELCAVEEKDVLLHRREELKLTQQQVADRARIQLRQYQRFENGERSISSSSMRIGLSVCAVLKLDPYMMIGRH